LHDNELRAQNLTLAICKKSFYKS